MRQLKNLVLNVAILSSIFIPCNYALWTRGRQCSMSAKNVVTSIPWTIKTSTSSNECTKDLRAQQGPHCYTDTLWMYYIGEMVIGFDVSGRSLLSEWKVGDKNSCYIYRLFLFDVKIHHRFVVSWVLKLLSTWAFQGVGLFLAGRWFDDVWPNNFENWSETKRLCHRNVSQHLPVQVNLGPRHSVNHLIVGNTVNSSGCIHSHDPQFSIFPFLDLEI